MPASAEVPPAKPASAERGIAPSLAPNHGHDPRAGQPARKLATDEETDDEIVEIISVAKPAQPARPLPSDNEVGEIIRRTAQHIVKERVVQRIRERLVAPRPVAMLSEFPSKQAQLLQTSWNAEMSHHMLQQQHQRLHQLQQEYLQCAHYAGRRAQDNKSSWLAKKKILRGLSRQLVVQLIVGKDRSDAEVRELVDQITTLEIDLKECGPPA
jgi:hypothetical protein